MNIMYEEDLARGLVEELLDTIHQYDETMNMATVLGCLDIVRMHLVMEVLDREDDD